MYDMKLTDKGLMKLKGLPDALDDKYTKALQQIVINVAEQVIREAKANTTTGNYEPYKGKGGVIIKTGITGGTLQNAWTRTPIFKSRGAYKVRVFNPIEYAQYYEYGHRQTVGRYVPQIGKTLVNPFVKGRYPLKKAIAKVNTEVSRIINQELLKAGIQ